MPTNEPIKLSTASTPGPLAVTDEVLALRAVAGTSPVQYTNVRGVLPTAAAGAAAGPALSLAWAPGQFTYKAGQLLHNSLGVDFYPVDDVRNPTQEPFIAGSIPSTNGLYHLLGPDPALAARVGAIEAIVRPGTGAESGRIGGASIDNSGSRSGSAGGYLNTNSGPESGSLGGGGNTNSGPDCASLGGAQNQNTGNCCTSQGGLRNHNTGLYSASIGGQDNVNNGDYSTMDSCQSCAIPRSCSFVRLSQCNGFTVPEGSNYVSYIGNRRVLTDTATPLATLLPAPTNLAVDVNRNVTFTPGASLAITTYEYSFAGSAYLPVPAGTLTLSGSVGTLAVRIIGTNGTSNAPGGQAAVLIVGATGSSTTYNRTLTAAAPAADSVTLTIANGYTVTAGFNASTAAGDVPGRMSIFLASTQVALLDFTSRYTGAAVTITVNGTAYIKTFIDNSITL